MLDGCADVVRRPRPVTVEANLRIARGLDYYTGTVVEIFMEGYERLKSVGGGGRYDALADDGRTTYPGVGISFGVSRTLVPLIAEGVLTGSRAVPSAVLVALADEESRPASDARRRRAARPRHRLRGGRRARRSTAGRSGTPSAGASRSSGSPRRTGDGSDQVKDIRSGDQVDADAATLDRRPTPTSDPRSVTPDTPGDDSVIRTHDAGTLSAAHVGQTVTLAGWVARRRDHGGVAFIDLREASGVVQVVIRDEEVAHSLRSEYCLKVTGEVRERPEGNANPNLPTGEIEVDRRRGRGAQPECGRCRSRSTTPGHRRAATWARRRGSSTATSTCAAAGPAAAIRLRSKVNRAARDVLDEHGFVEIETPTLTRSTPEGARDFLVPARLQPGQLVRPAAEPAAVQAAAHGRRDGALLPDRALLPRRGLPRRPAAGVHPARHRDELRRPGRRASRSPRTCSSRCGS